MAAGKPVTNEPTWAVLVTGLICWVGILIAALDDYVAPFVTLFFLMCYLFVNVACVLQSFLKAPSWRPKWRYYHFSLSCVGSVLCLFLMVMVGLELLFIVLVLALSLYKYIAYKGKCTFNIKTAPINFYIRSWKGMGWWNKRSLLDDCSLRTLSTAKDKNPHKELSTTAAGFLGIWRKEGNCQPGDHLRCSTAQSW